MTKAKSGLYSLNNKPVVLTGINIFSKIERFIAETTITQHFRNTEDVNIETVYCFPIENPAALYSFKIKTTSSELSARHEERNSAYDTYDQSLENGDSAYKLELAEKNILELAIGNLAPGEEITVTIEIISHLTTIDGIITLRIPTALSPLYVPANVSWENNAISAPPFQISVPYGVSICAHINMPGITNLRSPSHHIQAEEMDKFYLVSLLHQEPPDRDFVLEFELENMNLPQCIVSRHRNGRMAAMIKFQPIFELLPKANQLKSDIIFMFDCSSSMAYSYIDPAREALELCMRSMSEGDYFNILIFGSECRFFSTHQVEYNQNNLEVFLQMLSEVQADMGGTELLDALKEVCDIPVMPNCRREVILITDGEVYNTRETLQYVAKNHNGSRFYTFGIGRGASQALVKGLADITGGFSEIIAPGENIQEKVLRQFSRIIQPEVSNLKISVKNATIILPEKFRPLYEEDSLTILSEVSEIGTDAEIIISAQMDGEIFIWECPVEYLGDDDKIPLLWAVDHINELEEKSYLDQLNAKFLTANILECAEEFNILSHFSSMLAVENRTEEDKTESYPAFRIVPIMLHRARSTDGNADSEDEFMSCVHENQNTYMLSSTSVEAKSWYHEVLKTQDACGRFSSARIVADKLQLSPDSLQKHLTRNHENEQGNKNLAVLTAVTVSLLQTDPDAAPVAARALKKAQKWLDSLHDKESVFKKSRELLDKLKK